MSRIDPLLESRIRSHLEQGQPTQAIEVALRGYTAALLQMLRLRLRRAPEPEVQEAFGDLCERLCQDVGRFRGESAFLTWAQGVARHTAAQHRRRARRRRAQELSGLGEQTLERVGGARTPRTATHPYKRSAVRARVAALAAALPDDAQQLIDLHLAQRLPWDAVARALWREPEPLLGAELTRRAAMLRRRFSRAVYRLREALQKDAALQVAAALTLLSPRERRLFKVALCQELPWETLLLQVGVPRDEAALRGEIASLRARVLRTCQQAGLLPAELAAAGVPVEDDGAAAAGSPAKSRRSPR